MDAKLKLKLNEATGAVFAKYKKTGLDSPKVGLASPKAESSTLSRRLADLTRRHLSRKAQWGNIQAELALEALVQIFDRKLRPRQSENENQFMLPGFDHLPKSVHIGKVRTGLLKLDVPRFLDYVAWRELRVQRDQQQERNCNVWPSWSRHTNKRALPWPKHSRGRKPSRPS